jgi:AcrR family transcriptional regulator
MPRRDTRELILATSLALFNSHGEPNVTTNHIADEADISPGNLYYHFRSKDDIIIELFKRFLARLQPVIDIPDDALLSADDLWFQLHMGFEVKGDYRFLYRNLADLVARIPELDRAMRALLARERQAALNSLGGLEQAGLANFSGLQKELLAQNLQLALTYWIPFAELQNPRALEDGSAQVFGIARVLMLVAPYLREPERERLVDIAYQYLDKVIK